MNTVSYRRPVNYYETDKMAIVHHSNYIRYLEEARIYHLEQNGITFLSLEEQGLQIPVTEVRCKYQTPARFGDTLDIVTRIDSFNGVRLTYHYEIRYGSTLIATAETGHAFLSEKGIPLSLKRKYPDLYERFLALVGET